MNNRHSWCWFKCGAHLQMKIMMGWLFPLMAYAADYHVKEAAFVFSASAPQDCFNVGDIRHLRLCVEHFYSGSEAALEMTLNRISGRLERDTELFEDAQVKWLAFKNSECQVRSVSAQAFRNPEQQHHLFFQACAAELNAARNSQLNTIPLGCDSCLQ